MLRVGLVSDTHGLLRPEALAFLAGCDHIVHGGDIGKPEVLAALAELAPLTAVRGNNDTGPWAAGLPATRTLRLAGAVLFVLHDLKDLQSFRVPPDVDVIVCGHSHRPLVQRRPDGLLIVNPGSAGPRRFKLPVTAAELAIRRGGRCEARIAGLLQEAGPGVWDNSAP